METLRHRSEIDRNRAGLWAPPRAFLAWLRPVLGAIGVPNRRIAAGSLKVFRALLAQPSGGWFSCSLGHSGPGGRKPALGLNFRSPTSVSGPKLPRPNARAVWGRILVRLYQVSGQEGPKIGPGSPARGPEAVLSKLQCKWSLLRSRRLSTWFLVRSTALPGRLGGGSGRPVPQLGPVALLTNV